MTAPNYLAAYRVTRPARALVLVPLPDGVPWHAAMMSALRGQAATWGGSANLVVPWTDDLLGRKELWAIASALDPDVIAVARLAESDFAGIVAEDDLLPVTGEGLGSRGHAELEAVLRAFGQRLPVLQRNGQARRLLADSAGVRFPCTPVAAVRGDPGPVSALRCTASYGLPLVA